MLRYVWPDVILFIPDSLANLTNIPDHVPGHPSCTSEAQGVHGAVIK